MSRATKKRDRRRRRLIARKKKAQRRTAQRANVWLEPVVNKPEASDEEYRTQLVRYKAVPPDQREKFLESLCDDSEVDYDIDLFFDALSDEVEGLTVDAYLLSVLRDPDSRMIAIVRAVEAAGHAETAALMLSVLKVMGYPITDEQIEAEEAARARLLG